MSALILSRGRSSGERVVTTPTSYQGNAEPSIGIPNETFRIPPPQPSQPEAEQGLGRGPAEKWEHKSHELNLSPWVHLDQPGSGPIQGEAGYNRLDAPVATNIAGLPQSVTWSEGERDERLMENGPMTGNAAAVVVPSPPIVSQTAQRKLVFPGSAAQPR